MDPLDVSFELQGCGEGEVAVIGVRTNVRVTPLNVIRELVSIFKGKITMGAGQSLVFDGLELDRLELGHVNLGWSTPLLPIRPGAWTAGLSCGLEILLSSSGGPSSSQLHGLSTLFTTIQLVI